MIYIFQNIKYSYISEHMLIKTEYMKTLWDIIESNNNWPGKNYWEKIILSIDKEVILNSGFSEFETYVTFIDNYFPNAYKHRMWFSRRDMTKYVGSIYNLSEKDLKWLSKDYNAITFEYWYIGIYIMKITISMWLIKHYKIYADQRDILNFP